MFQRPGDAAFAQREMMQQQIPVAMMPTPRDLSASCGLSLRFSPQHANTVSSALIALFPESGRCRFYQAVREQNRHRYHPVLPPEKS
ncbi:MAG: DUF3343 domain-containing protein [Oscillospiraceae bacterium]|nr:DUF3343 domain-containing protein [Oscillospiraceae bacterium]